MSKCVFCFHGLPSNVARFVCTNIRCNAQRSQDDPTLSSYVGEAVKTGVNFTAQQPPDAKRWTKPNGVPCGQCGEQMSNSCPTCHHVIPHDSDTADIVTVGFTGARNSGKSVAIGSMSFFLEELIEQMGSARQYRPAYSRSTPADYEEQLLGGTAPAMTTRGRARSLVFNLGPVNGRTRYLSLRDVAGEDLENSTPEANLTFLSRADLVVFMFDPLAIDSVLHELADLIPAQPGRVGVAPQTVLTNVLQHIGSGRPRLAVALSKVDALQALAGRPGNYGEVFGQPGAAISRDWKLTPTYHARDGELLHEEVRSVLQALNAGVIVNMIENPASGARLDHRFFAVSALGGATDAQAIDTRGIRPFRILEPLLWEFANRGIVASA